MCHVVSPQVADPMIQQGQHAIRVERQDVHADVQLSLKTQQWEEPAGLHLLPRVTADDERQILPPVDLDVISAVGESLALGPQVAILTPAAIEFGKQPGQGIVAEQLSLDADSTKLFDQRLSTQA